MIFQTVSFTDFEPTLSFVILLIFMILMLTIYLKVRKPFLLGLVVFLFSLIIGTSAIVESNIPFTPYIQIFFLLFQSVIFLLEGLEKYRK